jgi:uncharacterized protein
MDFLKGMLMLPLLQDYRYYDVFSAVFKISDRCNLACSYCYRENAQQNEKSHHMPFEVIDNTLNSILEYKQWLYALYDWSKQPSLYFIWHGGEPLMVGFDRMNEILAIQEKYRKKGLIIHNGIQTNGTLIDEQFLNTFKREKFMIGVSIDGPEEVHNQHRVYRNGTRSFNATYSGIQTLKKHNYMWSAISVLSKESIGKEKEIFEFFKAEKPNEVDFTPAFYYDTSISLAPEDYSKFMIKMFDLWISEKELPFEIRFFKDIFHILGYKNTQKPTLICELSGMCHRNISVMTNGDIYTCECLNGDPSKKIGNILREPFTKIVNDEPFIKLSQSTNVYCKECISCDVFSVCKAGCFNRRLPNESGEPRLDFYCSARKAIIHHIMDWMGKSQAI